VAINPLHRHDPSRLGHVHQARRIGHYLSRHGLQIGEIVGLGPRVRKPVVLLNFVRANRGRISYGELSRRLDFGQVKEASIPYMCFASKTG
jgi:2-polyprenyl-6-hydroxyphenyl methylase/3-demethylubiquinone-9 3-methyltransferase